MSAVGVSIGPFPDIHAERQVVAFLKELDIVHCRDTASFDFVRQLDVGGEIINGIDLAFSVKALRPDLFVSNVKTDRVGASFILNPKLLLAEQEEQFSKMLSLVNYLTMSGSEVLLVSLYSGAKYADDRLHRRLRESAKHPERVLLHDYQGDLQGTIAQISSCSFYLSMRLHGLVTAYLAGVPIMPLNRHPKVLEFCSAIGSETGGCDFSMPLDEILRSLQNRLSNKVSDYFSFGDSGYYSSADAFSAAIDGV